MCTSIRVWLCVLFVCFFLVLDAQDESNKLDSGFAEFLYNSELYELAAEEYERLLYYDAENIAYLSKLLKCYSFTGKEQLMEQRFDLSKTTNKELTLSYFDLLLSLRKPEKFESLYHQQKALFTEEESQNIQLKLATLQYDWTEVQSHIQTRNLDQYSSIYNKIEQSHFVKPGLAVGLSAVIPGLGRIYAKDTKDGLVSALFVGSFGYQTYRRFSNRGFSDVGGWIYGGLALGFYLSNLYGTYQSAKYYNNKQNERIYNFSLPKLLTESQ